MLNTTHSNSVMQLDWQMDSVQLCIIIGIKPFLDHRLKMLFCFQIPDSLPFKLSSVTKDVFSIAGSGNHDNCVGLDIAVDGLVGIGKYVGHVLRGGPHMEDLFAPWF